MKFGNCLAVAVVLLAAASAAHARGPAATEASVTDLVVGNKDFTILVAALKAADPYFLRQLSRPRFVGTVYAPNDAAFVALLKALGATPEQLLSNTALLNRVLRYHITPGKVLTSSGFRSRQTIRTWLQGTDAGRLFVRKNKSGVRFITTSGNSAKVIAADIKAGQALVHVIDTVLIPGNN